jgi:hypothetical protein
MAVIETLTFRLTAGTDDAAFLAADRRLQTEFAYHQPGLVRRTTARSDDGEWFVVTLWSSGSDFDAAAATARSSPVVSEFAALLDEPSVRTSRYTTLD